MKNQIISKFERIYEDDDSITIWKYDLSKSNGPIEVKIDYKKGIEKNWTKVQKEAKDIRRTERQMKKITLSNSVKTGKRGRPKKK